ncbi:MAG: hypothetical protein HC892_00385 [Saprospiraceae bacterium]|nr:hypothetical protein [Saprospiraceae bacterium]
MWVNTAEVIHYAVKFDTNTPTAAQADAVNAHKAISAMQLDDKIRYRLHNQLNQAVWEDSLAMLRTRIHPIDDQLVYQPTALVIAGVKYKIGYGSATKPCNSMFAVPGELLKTEITEAYYGLWFRGFIKIDGVIFWGEVSDTEHHNAFIMVNRVDKDGTVWLNFAEIVRVGFDHFSWDNETGTFTDAEIVERPMYTTPTPRKNSFRSPGVEGLDEKTE